MNIFRFNRVRMCQCFLFLGIFSTVTLFYHYYCGWKPEGASPKVLRSIRNLIPEKTTLAQQDVMLSRLETTDERCHSDDMIRRSKRFRYPIALNSENPFYRFKGSKTCMCKVPKVASTMLSKLLLAAEFPINSSYIRNMPGYYVHSESLTSRFQRSGCYDKSDFKFIFVRNPYSRIYSAYIDKIFLGKFRLYSAKVQFYTGQNKSARNYLRNGSSISRKFLCQYHDVTFDAFLRWILFYYKVDWHFAPITTFCDPCKHPFDVIIKQENTRKEVKHITDHLSVYMDTTMFTDSNNEDKILDLIVILHDLWNSSAYDDHCDKSYVNYTFLNERFWSALKIQGYISKHQRTETAIFFPDSPPDDACNRFKALKIPYLSDKDRSEQRYSYLVEAYKALDPDLIKQFQKRFYADFLLFDYDLDPPF